MLGWLRIGGKVCVLVLVFEQHIFDIVIQLLENEILFFFSLEFRRANESHNFFSHTMRKLF